MHQRIGPGLLEVPEESNARGLREVGCLPGAGPGLAPAAGGRDSAEIKEGLAAGDVRRPPPAQRRPRPHPPRLRRAGASALGKAFVVSVAMFDDESTRHADIVLPAETHAEKEGTVTHPDGRLQRLRRNVPLPDDVRPGWQFLTELSTALGRDLGLATAAEVFDALSKEVPFYDTLTYEEIGGTGFRWQDRDPGTSWIPSDAVEASCHPAFPCGAAGVPRGTVCSRRIRQHGDLVAYGRRIRSRRRMPAAPSNGLLLGTYRDLWAVDATERNPALRFLMPKQKLELAAKDAADLELGNGDPVTVSVNGSSVEAAGRDPRADGSGCRLPDRGDEGGQRERARERRRRGGSR